MQIVALILSSKKSFSDLETGRTKNGIYILSDVEIFVLTGNFFGVNLRSSKIIE